MNRTRTQVDRRIQNTKRALSLALVDLILEKGYARVTVQDILDRAGVGRATFYSHYENKDRLLLSGPRNLGHALFDPEAAPGADTKRSHPMAFRSLFEHVNEARSLAKAILGRKCGMLLMDSFRAQIATAIRDHYGGQMTKRQRNSGCAYLVEAAACAVGSLLSSWVDDDFGMPVAELSRQCQRLVEGIFQ